MPPSNTIYYSVFSETYITEYKADSNWMSWQGVPDKR